MAGQVHPRDGDTGSPSIVLEHKALLPEKKSAPSPTPGTYIIEIPKDQIYRYPPPENAYRFRKYTSQGKKRRNSCCCCLGWILGITLALTAILTATVGILYLVFQPKLPKYTVEKISIHGFNFSSASPGKNILVSPRFDVTVKAHNPNKKISIYYSKGSSVTLSHERTTTLSKGVLPVFHQGTRNVTIYETVLKGSGLELPSSVVKTLTGQQSKGEVPLGLDLKVPVKIKIGSVKTWTITVKVRCDLTVDKLSINSKIVSKECHVDIKL